MEANFLELIQIAKEQILALNLAPRDIEERLLESLEVKPIKIISGFRRAGKSSLVHNLIKKTLNKKFKFQNILYLNFEDYRFASINSLAKLDEAYRYFLNFSAEMDSPKLLIFDEIQNIPNWDKFARTLADYNQRDQIIFTGSNSEMLSSELGTNLGGRFIEFKLLPFSFKEFICYKGLSVTELNEAPMQRSTLFYDYFNKGGLIDVHNINNDQTRADFIDGIISKIILDDVVKRFNIRNATAIELILKFVFSNIGKPLSGSKLAKHFKELKINIEEDTISDYLLYLEKTFAIDELLKFDWSSRKIFSKLKKFYAIDLSLIRSYCRDIGFQLENLVYLQLKRDPCVSHIYYGATTKSEIDFITEDRQGSYVKYQVTVKLTDTNYDRELKAFTHVDEHLQKYSNLILVLEGEDKELEYKGVKILQRNIINWLIGT